MLNITDFLMFYIWCMFSKCLNFSFQFASGEVTHLDSHEDWASKLNQATTSLTTATYWYLFS